MVSRPPAKLLLACSLALACFFVACHSPSSDPGFAYQQLRLQQQRGELNEALQLADQSYRRYQKQSPEWEWRFRVLKAHTLCSLERYPETLQLLQAPPPASLASSEDAVRQSIVVGFAQIGLFDFADAGNSLRIAELIAKRSQSNMLADVDLANFSLELAQNHLQAAESLAAHALALSREHNLLFQQAYALNALGRVAMLREHYDQATDLFQQALLTAEPVSAKGTIERVHGNLGWSYFKLGDFDRSIEYSQKAATMAAELRQPDRVKWIMNMGTASMNQGQLAVADETYQQALKLARDLQDKTSQIQCLVNLAFVALRRHDADGAKKWNDQAQQLEKETGNRTEGFFSSVIAGRIAAAQGDYRRAETQLRDVLQESAASDSLRLYARERLAKMYADAGRHVDAEREFRQCLHLIEQGRSSVANEELRLSFLTAEASFYDDYISFLAHRGRFYDALQVAELSRARTLAEGLGAVAKEPTFPLPNFHPERTAQRLRAALLFYWLGESQSYLWVITPARTISLTLLAANEIDALVKSYREAVVSGRDVLETGNADGNKLYALLIEPAKKWIPPNSRVILLPDGSLYGFNFETLIAPEPKPHFWIEDVTLSTASSLTLLSASAAKPANTVPGVPAVSRQAQGTDTSADRLLLVGNAVSSSPDFPPLRQAASEIDHISHYFPGGRRDVLTGSQATPAAFLQRGPESFGYLHFVTHGIASRTHPLDSAVILSPEPGDAASFKLYAREIVKHRLSAYLVTISACNGSGTRAFSGEGLVGLSWAFLRAGAHNVIAALWEVNDASTPQLMGAMYAELARGRSPADALRAAKLSLLQTDSVFRKPFYWAPFQLYSGS